MRECIIEEHYSPYSGASRVVKSNKWGTFVGRAICDADDYDSGEMNENIGLQLAEYKADIEAARERAKCLRERMKGVQNLVNSLDGVQITTYEMGELWDKVLYQCTVARREYERAKKEFVALKDGYPEYVEKICNQ